MECEVGDLVVAPGFGVGKVEAIEKMDLGDDEVEVYRINLGDREKMWVPVGRVVAEGLRAVIPEEKVETLFEVIEAQEAPKRRTHWNRRRKRYNEAMMSNEPTAMAELLGELAAVRAKKSLSFGERRIFDRVKDLLVDEIAAALGKKRAAVEEDLDERLTPEPEAEAA